MENHYSNYNDNDRTIIIIPMVIEALGIITKGLEGYLKEIGVAARVKLLQNQHCANCQDTCNGS